MAEFCLKCAREILGMTGPEVDRCVISEDLDLCEGCGEWKHVVVRIKEPTPKRFEFSLLRILFGGMLSVFLLFALAGCGGSADSIRVNAPEGVEVSVSETVDGDGVRHAEIFWEES